MVFLIFCHEWELCQSTGFHLNARILSIIFLKTIEKFPAITLAEMNETFLLHNHHQILPIFYPEKGYFAAWWEGKR